MRLPRIVGISGTNGAGKDELGKLLQERCGYSFHSVSELLRDELARTGQVINRENQSALSKKWRNESGDNAIMFTKAINAFLAEEKAKGYKGLALVNARHPDEARRIHEYGGVIVWVDADQRLRYDRLQASGRGRADDQISFEQFQSDEYREMHPPIDAPGGSLNMKAVYDLADIVIENNFPTIGAYRDYLIEKFELRLTRNL